MNIYKVIDMLPETISQDRLDEYFDWIVDNVTATNLNEKEKISKVLYELSDRQWHNYQKINQGLLIEIDSYVEKLLVGELSLLFIENISRIIGQLGLAESYVAFKKLLKSENVDDIIKVEIADSIAEYGEYVDDPYR